MNIDSALRLLASRAAHPVARDEVGDRIGRLLHVLGDPHEAAPVVAVTGPGAASVAAMATALLRAQGLSVGTVTSTALEQVPERLAWDGTIVDDDTFATLVSDVTAVEELAGLTAAGSEIVVAAAFRWFAEVAVDVVVLEAGHDDPVALVEPTVAVGADEHGTVSVASPDGAWMVDRDFGVAVDKVAVGGRLLDLRTPDAQHDDVYVPVHGSHQAAAAATALAAVEAFLGRPQDTEVVTEALGELRLPGRFEVVARHPTVVVDVVIDARAAEATATTLAEDMMLPGSVLMVVGFRAGPDPEAILHALGVADAGLVVACAPEGAGVVAASDLVGVAERLGAVAETVPDPVDAVNRALAVATEDDLVLVAGAPEIVGPVRAALREMDVPA